MAKVDQKTINTVVLSSLIGATIEWYDFFLYGLMASIVLNKLFSQLAMRRLLSCLPMPPLLLVF